MNGAKLGKFFGSLLTLEVAETIGPNLEVCDVTERHIEAKQLTPEPYATKAPRIICSQCISGSDHRLDSREEGVRQSINGLCNFLR